MEVKALRIIEMFKQYKMWWREITDSNSGILARMTLLKWEIQRKLYQTTKSLLKKTNRHMSRINTIYRHIIRIIKRWMKVNERSKTSEYMNKLNKGTR